MDFGTRGWEGTQGKKQTKFETNFKKKKKGQRKRLCEKPPKGKREKTTRKGRSEILQKGEK